MAKHIYLSGEELVKFNEKIAKYRVIDGELKVSMPTDARRARLLFSPVAWVKMFGLVDAFATEVQWHGTVERVNENTFFIEDIFVLPHEAGSATVISDQEEYEQALMDLPADVFLRNRFHGHSHVNMSVFPSGVDNTYRKNMINNFSATPSEDEDQFYIFLICNKKREISGQVFDLKYNALYETSDIQIDVDFGTHGSLNGFISDTKKIVKLSTPPVATSYKGDWYEEHGRRYNQHQYLNQSPTPKTETSSYPDVSFETQEEWQKQVLRSNKV